MRPAVDAGDGSQGRAKPVDHEEFHWSVSTAAKLETSSEDGVEISTTGGKSSADHTGGNETVHGHSMLGFLEGNEAGSNPADPSGHTLDDGCVENRHSEVSGADIVNRGVGTANMSLSNLYGPKDLDQSREGSFINKLTQHI